MSLLQGLPKVTSLAMYRQDTEELVGTLRMFLVDEEVAPKTMKSRYFPDPPRDISSLNCQIAFRWQTRGARSLDEELFPSESTPTLPPFFLDFVHQYKGSREGILDFLLRNHSSSQDAIALVEWDAWTMPEQNLVSALVQELSLGRYVPLRVCEAVRDKMPRQAVEVFEKRKKYAQLGESWFEVPSKSNLSAA
jgi:hypothetical protein